MKFLRGFLIFLGVLALTGALAVGIAFLVKPSGAPVAEGAGAISPEMVAQAQDIASRMGRRMAWIMILISAMLQLFAWVAALAKLRSVKAAGFGTPRTIELLETIDIYFDLPLYFGLLGSVGSFIVITFFPDAGLMFAYASTAMGIIVSVVLRLGYLTPYRQALQMKPVDAE